MATATDAAEQANRAGMDPKRLVAIFLLVSAIVIGMFFERMFASIWAQFGWPNREVIEGLDWRVTSLVGFGLSIAAALGSFLHPVPRGLLVEVSGELMKVTWPRWPETRVSTVAVIVASVIASIILFGIDSAAFTFMVEWIPVLWGKL